MLVKSFQTISIFLIALLFSCSPTEQKSGAEAKEEKEKTPTERIVSTNGTLSEIVVALGLEKQLVGVDVTSTYPETLKEIPSIGHQRSMTSEGILSLNPTLVIGVKDNLQENIITQLEQAGIKVLLFEHEFSPVGVENLVLEMGDALSQPEKAKEIVAEVKADFKQLETGTATDLKVLFLYARGAGTVMAFGEETQANDLIHLSGAINAVSGYEGCKSITPEALVEANPDVVVMFNSGLKSLNGVEGVLEVPGMKETNAGKSKSFISFDGLYILGFGPRSGKAMMELNQKLNEISTQKVS